MVVNGGRPAVEQRGSRVVAAAGEHAHVITLAVVLAAGLGYLVVALGLPFEGYGSPSPGLFPRFAAVLVLVSALASLLLHLTRRSGAPAVHDEDEEPESTIGDAAWRVPALVACLGLYVVLAPLAGHVLAAALVSFVVLLMLDERPRWQMAAYAIGFALGSYGLFTLVLGVTLPAGMWSA